MSQKTNPISLRLQKSNKYFSLCWYSDYFYDQRNEHYWKIRSYIETLSNQVGHLQMFPYLQTHFKRSYMYLFFLDVRAIQLERKRALKMSRKGGRSVLSGGYISPLIIHKSKNISSLSSFFSDKRLQEKKEDFSFLFRKKNIEKGSSACTKEASRKENNTLYYNSTKRINAIDLLNKQEDKKAKAIAYAQKKSNFSFTQELKSTLFKHIVIETCWKGVFNPQEDFFKQKALRKNNLCVPFAESNVSNTFSGDAECIKKTHYPLVFLSGDRKKIPIRLQFSDPLSTPFSFKELKDTQKEGVSKYATLPAVQKNKFQTEKEFFHHNFVEIMAKDSLPSLTLTVAKLWDFEPFKTKHFFVPQGYGKSSCTAREQEKRNSNTITELAAESAVIPQVPFEVFSKPQVTQKERFHLSRTSQVLEKSLAVGASLKKSQVFTQAAEKISIYPIRVLQDGQNAIFVANGIVDLLQKNISFRQIKEQIFRELKKNEIIKGVRLSCSGRVGGRSKKAQKSKTQSMQWGQTELHFFSSKLSFAKKSAITPFGKIGIKVWLCYK